MERREAVSEMPKPRSKFDGLKSRFDDSEQCRFSSSAMLMTADGSFLPNNPTQFVYLLREQPLSWILCWTWYMYVPFTPNGATQWRRDARLYQLKLPLFDESCFVLWKIVMADFDIHEQREGPSHLWFGWNFRQTIIIYQRNWTQDSFIWRKYLFNLSIRQRSDGDGPRSLRRLLETGWNRKIETYKLKVISMGCSHSIFNNHSQFSFLRGVNH